MELIVVDPIRLSKVRQLEALSSRVWVAEDIFYDRTWVFRRTEDFLSRRLNSVTPLDPMDGENVEERIKRFSLSIPLRATPLVPPAVINYCQGTNWKKSVSIFVVLGKVCSSVQEECCVRVVKDMEYVTTLFKKQSFLALLRRVKCEKLHFLGEMGGIVFANMLVVCDGDFAGILDFSIRRNFDKENAKRGFITRVWSRLKEKNIAKVWLEVTRSRESLSLFQLLLDSSFQVSYSYEYAYWS
ncbi:MAG: hypothetical protein JSC161_000147 [Candidatus Tokpelaia sp. JSC161]|jgi:hypothetical protein|nr:MAG: hypothetical protein JSC161_000147 [Candidatus Tokpelaia sp. JSC161]